MHTLLQHEIHLIKSRQKGIYSEAPSVGGSLSSLLSPFYKLYFAPQQSMPMKYKHHLAQEVLMNLTCVHRAFTDNAACLFTPLVCCAVQNFCQG